jgi:two-component system, NarL family, sensor histidine kinase UhpB
VPCSRVFTISCRRSIRANTHFRSSYAEDVTTPTTLPLYWRVCLINGAVFIAGTLALVLSPATISAEVLRSEAIVLSVGLTAILVTNALLLRTVLTPLDRLSRLMSTIDLRRPGQRLPVAGSGVVAELIHTFNAMLARLEAERSASTGRVLAAQETERQRIGRELHDEVGQMLTVVLLGLQQAGHRAPPDLAADLQSLQDSTRTSLDEVRRIAGRLRPGMLENLGLVSSLNALATEFTSHTEVRVRRGFAPGLPQMSRETELVIYRVTQEALTNIARHARASTVQLTLSRQGNGVTLRIADDGAGMRDSEAASGIQGMQERALLVGGKLTIEPCVGGGTEITLAIPNGDQP